MQTDGAVSERVRTRWTKAELALARSALTDFDPARQPLEAWVATLGPRFPGRDLKALVKKFAQLAGVQRRTVRRRRGKGPGVPAAPANPAVNGPGAGPDIPPALLKGAMELLTARAAILRVRERICALETELARLREEESRLVDSYQPRLADLLRQELSV